MTGRPVAGLWHRSCAATRPCACWRGPGGGPLNGGCLSGCGARPRRGLSGRRPGAAGWSWLGAGRPVRRGAFVRRGAPVSYGGVAPVGGRLVRECPSAAGCFVAPGMPGHVSGRCPGLQAGPRPRAGSCGRPVPGAVRPPPSPCRSAGRARRRRQDDTGMPLPRRGPFPLSPGHRSLRRRAGPVSPAVPGASHTPSPCGAGPGSAAASGTSRPRRRIPPASRGSASRPPPASRGLPTCASRRAPRRRRRRRRRVCPSRRRPPAPLAGTRQGSFPPCSVNSLVPQAP